MGFSSSSQIIETLKKQLGLDVDFFTVLKIWEKEVGVQDVDIYGYKNGTIMTMAYSGVAANEINLRKKEIIKKMNQYLGEKKIKNIKVKIGE
jgi:hypothetical protein